MTKVLLAITEMTVGESLLTAVLGIAVVMAVLALLAGIITVMSKVVSNLDKEEAAPAAKPVPAAAPAAPAAPAKPQGKPIPETQSRGQCDLTTVDDKTAAMLMAIVADQMGEPLNTLRFTSIRPID